MASDSGPRSHRRLSHKRPLQLHLPRWLNAGRCQCNWSPNHGHEFLQYTTASCTKLTGEADKGMPRQPEVLVWTTLNYPQNLLSQWLPSWRDRIAWLPHTTISPLPLEQFEQNRLISLLAASSSQPLSLRQGGGVACCAPDVRSVYRELHLGRVRGRGLW